MGVYDDSQSPSGKATYFPDPDRTCVTTDDGEQIEYDSEEYVVPQEVIERYETVRRGGITLPSALVNAFDELGSLFTYTTEIAIILMLYAEGGLTGEIKDSALSYLAGLMVTNGAALAAGGATAYIATKAAARGLVKRLVSQARERLGCIVDRIIGDLHHIATNKNWVSDIRGGPWSPKFAELFRRAGRTLEDAVNKVYVKGHKGPHPEEYHAAVYDRLARAVQGKSGPSYANALDRELAAIAKELQTPGSYLNKLVTQA